MKFNAAPPPATIYSAEVALAAAAQAVEAANRAKFGVSLLHTSASFETLRCVLIPRWPQDILSAPACT